MLEVVNHASFPSPLACIVGDAEARLKLYLLFFSFLVLFLFVL